MANLVQLIGGNFQDVFGNPVVNGKLRLVLTQSENSTDGYWYEDLSPFTTQEVCNGLELYIPLDETGNIVTSPAFFVYANNELLPKNSYYLVYLYSSVGQLLWGPNPQQVLQTYSPPITEFDVGQWVPGQIIEYA